MLVTVRTTSWIAAVGVVALGATALLAQTPPRFRTGVDVVVVEATVVDRDGAIVAGLGPADFAVEIDGKSREIVAADLVRHESAAAAAASAVSNPDISSNTEATAGRTVLVVIDYVSLRSQSRPVLDTAGEWVASLGPTDRVGLMALPQPGLNIEFTTDHARVIDALKKIAPHPHPPPPFSQRNVSPWEAVRMYEGDTFIRNEVLTRECRGEPNCPAEIDMQVRSLQMDMQSTVLPVVQSLRGLMRAMRVLPGPKHVLLLSSGWLMSERDAATELSLVAADAALANVTVHTFTTEQWGQAASRSRPTPRLLQDAGLLTTSVETLSGMTGGRAVRLYGKADLAFASLTAGLGGYYRLGVQALAEDLDGKARKISVKVLRPGAKLAGNRRILAATASAETKSGGDPKAALRAALETPTPVLDIDVRATSYVLHAAAGSRDVRVVVVGDVGRAAAGKATAVAALYDLDGKPVNAMENAVDVPEGGLGAVSIELTAKPGLYVLRVAVRDAEGRVGSLERPDRRALEEDRRGRHAGPRPLSLSARRGRAVGPPVRRGDHQGAGDLPGRVVRSVHGPGNADRLRGDATGQPDPGGPTRRPHRADDRRHHRRARRPAGRDASARPLRHERETRRRAGAAVARLYGDGRERASDAVR